VARDTPVAQDRTASGSMQHAELRALMPLYVVVFIGFVGYSLMITVFTPMLLRADTMMLAPGSTMPHRTVVLGVLLCLYPAGQFVGSPMLGSLSDRFGRRPVLLASLAATTLFYAGIRASISSHNLPLLGLATLLAGLAEGNIVTAQGAITDVVPAEQRNRYFGYIYMSASLAYVVGPLGGGKLADSNLVSWFTDATPFWASFALLLTTTLAILVLFRETAKLDTTHRVRVVEMFAALSHIFSDRQLRRFYGVNFLLYLAIFGFFRSYPMYLVDGYRMGVSRVSEFVAWVRRADRARQFVADGLFDRAASDQDHDRRVCRIDRHLHGRRRRTDNAARPVAAVVSNRCGAGHLPAQLRNLAVKCRTHGRSGSGHGQHQALQVAAEALSGLAAGLLAAVIVKLPLLVLGAIAIGTSILVALAI